MTISFFMPAYNCAATLAESVHSIMRGNFAPGDELLIADDGSTDETARVLEELRETYPELRVLRHPFNLGGGAARNTCVRHARHDLLFCLDADNVLAPGSVRPLIAHLRETGADVVSFAELRYFSGSTEHVSHTCAFGAETTLADSLSLPMVPGSGGNYLFTRASWERAGGYPHVWLDTWGFGFRQLATGAKMVALPGSYYFHRIGHESYFVREARKNDISVVATRILLPFLDLLTPEEAEYVLSDLGQAIWFTSLEERPLRLVPEALDRGYLQGRPAGIAPTTRTALVETRLVNPRTHQPLAVFRAHAFALDGDRFPLHGPVPAFAEHLSPLPGVSSGWMTPYVPACGLLLQLGGTPLEVPEGVAHFRLTESSGAGTGCDLLASPSALPFANEQVDVVVVPGTLERTENPLRALREIHRVLKTDGRLVLGLMGGASALSPDVSTTLDEAFRDWYLSPLFEVVETQPQGLVLRKVPDGQLWVTDGQLEALTERLETYRQARDLEAAGKREEATHRFRELASAETLLPLETPRRLYALIQVAPPGTREALRAALGLIGGPLATELGGEAANRSWEDLRAHLAVPEVADASVVLGLLSQLAHGAGQAELSEQLATWSYEVSV